MNVVQTLIYVMAMMISFFQEQSWSLFTFKFDFSLFDFYIVFFLFSFCLLIVFVFCLNFIVLLLFSRM